MPDAIPASDVTSVEPFPQGTSPATSPATIPASDVVSAVPTSIPASDVAQAAPNADYLNKLPTAGIVGQAKAALDADPALKAAYMGGTMNAAQQAQLEAYKAPYRTRAGKLELIQSNDLPADQQPPGAAPAELNGGSALDAAVNVLAKVGAVAGSIGASAVTAPLGQGFVGPDSVENFVQGVAEGTATHADEAAKGFLGFDPLTGIQQTPEQADRAQTNVMAGMGLGTFQAANMLRVATNRVANRLFQNSDAAKNDHAYNTQFEHDLNAKLVEEGLGTGVFNSEGDPDAIQKTSSSLFAQPNLLLPGAEGFSAGKFAARTLEDAPEDALNIPKTARQVAGKIAAAPMQAAARVLKPLARVVDASPVLSGTLAAAGSAALGAPPWDIMMGALLGSGEGKVKLLTKAADAFGEKADMLAGKVPPGPIGSFGLRAFDAVGKAWQSAVAGQLANTPFLMGADDQDQFKSLLAGGLIAHSVGSAAGSIANGLDINRNLFATAPTLPESRVPVKPYGNDEALDNAHNATTTQLGNSGNNFVQAVRDFFGKQRGELYALKPSDYEAALDSAVKQGHLDPQTAAQAKSQQGVSYTAPATIDTPARNIALSKVSQNTPGISVGHEAGHMLEKLLSPDELTHIYGQIQATYGADQFNAYRQKYADLANKNLQGNTTPVAPLTDSQTASEIFAEHVSAVLNSIPIAQFSDPSMSGAVPLTRQIYSLVGRGLEKIGAKVPELNSSDPNAVTTGTGIEPSAKLGHIIENVLQAHKLDASLLSGEQELGETPTSTPVAGAVAKEQPVGFKKGDETGSIKHPKAGVVGKNSVVTKPLGPGVIEGGNFVKQEGGELHYGVEYDHPKTGARMQGVVPESWLQRAPEKQNSAAAAGEKPASPAEATAAPGKAVVSPAGAAHVRESAAAQDTALKQATPEDLAHNKLLFDKAIAKPAEAGALEITHTGATTEKPDADQIVRERERLLSEAAADKGDNTLKQSNQKIIVPFRRTFAQEPNDGIFALDASKILQNKTILTQYLKRGPGAASLDPDIRAGYDYLTSPEINRDLQNYLKNQSNGYGGDGGKLVRPKDTKPGTIPEENGAYKPIKIDPKKVEVLNALMGYAPANKAGAREIQASDYFRRFAEGNHKKVGKTNLGLAETNPFRAKLKAAGFNTDLLNQATSQLRFRDITGKAKPRPDLNFSGGSTGITKAGFMPNVERVTQTPEFKKWFGESKVVDSDGKPLVVYHGTPAADLLTKFDTSAGTDFGLYFSNNPHEASEFARKNDDADVENVDDLRQGVVPAFLNLKNPKIIDAEGAHWSELPGGRLGRDSTVPDAAWSAHVAGYDGLIVKNVREGYRASEPQTTYVAFNPKQIKSATGNSGKFDSTNPDIRFMPEIGAENEHAKYIGEQEGAEPGESFSLYNLKHDINGHPAASTVSAQTLKDNGLPLPGLREQGNQDTRDVAASYMKAAGRPFEPHTDYARVDPERAKAIADFYDEAKHDPSNPAVKAAYEALTRETRTQWQAMQEAGIKAEPWEGKGEPYKDSAAMMKDVRENKHLWFFPTDDNSFGEAKTSLAARDNPLLENSGVKVNGHALLNNDLFRAVHDYFGHTAEGFEFGPRGEYNAYLAHSKMFSEEAKPALAAETLAQNSWVNYGKHLRRADGSIPERGDADFKPLAKRPFADQKSVVIPPHLLSESGHNPATSGHDVRFMPPVDPTKEHVDRAAIKLPSGKILSGEANDYHWKIRVDAISNGDLTDTDRLGVEEARRDGKISALDKKIQDGFISSTGRFLTRAEAFDVARQSGQVEKKIARSGLSDTLQLESAQLAENRKFMPAVAERPLPHAVPEKELSLVHYGQPGLTYTDPDKFGKSGITPKSELAGEPRSYFYEKGRENPEDPATNRRDVYSTHVSGARIYDADKDALGYRKLVNRQAADEMLKDAGYSGLARTAAGGKYRQVELYDRQPVESVSNPSFMPSPKPGSARFKEWFKDSKVITKTGEPQKVYHGTGADFRRFDMKRQIQGIIWFTSDKSKVERGEVGAAGKGHVKELYASIQNPANWEQYNKLGLYEFPREGLDGAILHNSDGSFDGFVFQPSQLKKAPGEKSSLANEKINKTKLKQ